MIFAVVPWTGLVAEITVNEAIGRQCTALSTHTHLARNGKIFNLLLYGGFGTLMNGVRIPRVIEVLPRTRGRTGYASIVSKNVLENSIWM
jgi:hypothetical protein